jgi:hypothetical protein
MWQQCVVWKKGGLTYGQVCGRLSTPENMRRFGIEEVPSEDTVRREVTQRIAAEAERESAATTGDQARQATYAVSAFLRYEHIKSLSYFGQCLGEHLWPFDLKELLLELVVNQDDLWFYENDSPQSPQQRDPAEIKVEKVWAIGRGRCDFRKHPMFGYFQQHLPGHPCWSVLEEVAHSYQQYLEAVGQAFAEVLNQVKAKLVHVSISDADLQYLALSLMTFAYKGGNMKFVYKPERREYQGRIYWVLNLGEQNVHREDPKEFKPIIEVHRRLAEEVLSWELIQTFTQKRAEAQRKTTEFKHSLQPYLLESLLRRSDCDWCR